MLVAIMYGVSVFVGIGVQIGVEYIKERKRIKQECENLKFEIICNISKIDKWLESIVDLRNKTQLPHSLGRESKRSLRELRSNWY